MSVQTQTTPQWRDALDKGNKVRLARARYKREIREGEHSARDVLTNPPAIVLDVPVSELLTWLPGIKRQRAQKILFTRPAIVYTEMMTLGRLSPVTRERLLARVVHHQPTRCRRNPHYTEVV